jgi:hypothetical protein
VIEGHIRSSGLPCKTLLPAPFTKFENIAALPEMCESNHMHAELTASPRGERVNTAKAKSFTVSRKRTLPPG